MEAFAHPSYMFADPYTHNVDRRGKNAYFKAQSLRA